MIIWSKFHKITLAEQKMRRAQLYRDKKMMEQAQNMPRPNCNRLNELTGGWSKCNLFKKLHVVNFMFKKPVCSALFFKLLYVKKNYLFYKYLPWEFYGKSVCQTNFIFFSLLWIVKPKCLSSNQKKIIFKTLTTWDI